MANRDPSISGVGNKGRKSIYNEKLNIKKYLFPNELDDFLLNNPDWRLGGPKHTEDELTKMSLKLSGTNNPMSGRKHTDEMKEKAHTTRKGKKWFTNGTVDVYCLPENAPDDYYPGATHMSRAGASNPMWGKTSFNGRKVKCLNTGEVFESKRKASFALPISIPMIDQSIASSSPVKNRAGELYQFDYID